MNTEDIKKTEDDVVKLLDSMEEGHKLIIYKTLYNEGNRIDNIDEKLRKIKKYSPLKTQNDIHPYNYSFV